MIYTFAQKKTGGYTLLFAVLVSSLVLAIGISILNIAKKEFLLATSARDSSAAIYAADSGLECAIYGDTGTFSTSGLARDAFNPTANRTANHGCYVPLQFTTVSLNTPGAGEGQFVFHIHPVTEGGACAKVTVTKTIVNTRLRTNITSLGYNTGWRIPDPNQPNIGFCDVASAKRVERGLSYTTY